MMKGPAMNANKTRTWTQEEIDVVIAMSNDGIGRAEICKALNRTIDSIRSVLFRLRLDGLIEDRGAGRPKVSLGKHVDYNAIDGSRKLRDAMIEYYRRYTWKDAALERTKP